MAASSMAPYLRLLADPCGGDFTPPPYPSVEGGYMVRTRDAITITGATIGANLIPGSVVSADALFQWTPSIGNVYGYRYGVGAPGATLTISQTSLSNFISSSSVRQARPVACCLRFVPTGPYSTRQGVVGRWYQTSATFPNASTVTAVDALDLCTRVDSTGACEHEVRWLPTMVDANFSKSDATNATESGGGTVGIVLKGVDFTASSSSQGNLNGYLEIVTVWQWTPQASQGLVSSSRAPVPFTVQDALSKITSVGEFIMGVAGRAITSDLRGSIAGGMIQMGLAAVTRPVARERKYPALTY